MHHAASRKNCREFWQVSLAICWILSISCWCLVCMWESRSWALLPTPSVWTFSCCCNTWTCARITWGSASTWLLAARSSTSLWPDLGFTIPGFIFSSMSLDKNLTFIHGLSQHPDPAQQWPEAASCPDSGRKFLELAKQSSGPAGAGSKTFDFTNELSPAPWWSARWRPRNLVATSRRTFCHTRTRFCTWFFTWAALDGIGGANCSGDPDEICNDDSSDSMCPGFILMSLVVGMVRELSTKMPYKNWLSSGRWLTLPRHRLK